MTHTRSTTAVSRRGALAGLGAGAVGLAVGLAPRGISRTIAQSGTPAPTNETDIVYGESGGQELRLDIHRPPARDQPRPAVVLIHGGGWTQGYGGRADMSPPARKLADAGYVAFNIAYRLLGSQADPQTWPAQLDDVQRAVRWVRANATTYGVDPKRIGSYGHSAGGHLAACLGVRDTRDNGDPELGAVSSRVTCVVDLAGDTDLTIPYPQEADRQIVRDLLGGTAEATPETYRDASPLSWVDERSTPFLILHGGRDDINPVEHSRRMAEALRTAGAEVVFGEFPDADHFAWASWDRTGPWALPFFARHLRPEA